jgi:hypothetical protein
MAYPNGTVRASQTYSSSTRTHVITLEDIA